MRRGTGALSQVDRLDRLPPDGRWSGKQPHRCRKRVLKWSAVLLLVAFLLVGVIPASIVLWPRSASPVRADAVVSLSGGPERVPVARRLVEGGVAPVLVLAGSPDTGEDIQLCRGDQPFEVVCLRPDPDSTRAEARSTGELAAQRKWRRIVVVTARFHLARARLLFDRCFDGEVIPVAAEPNLSREMLRQAYFHEWKGFMDAALFSRRC